MKAIVVTDQAAGTAGMTLVERAGLRTLLGIAAGHVPFTNKILDSPQATA